MWPFGRKQEEPPTDAGFQSGPVPAPVVRRDWAQLPPVQRSFGPMPLTAPRSGFDDKLASRRDDVIALAPLGHHIRPDAPHGVVLLASVPSSRSDGPAMITRRPVQRKSGSASPDWESINEEPAEATPSPSLPARGREIEPASPSPSFPVRGIEPASPSPSFPVRGIEPASPSSSLAATGREIEPTYALPIVEPAAAAPFEPLTRVAPDREPVPTASVISTTSLQTSAAAGAEPPTWPAPPAPRLTLGQSRRLGLGPPLRNIPAPAGDEYQEARAISQPEATPVFRAAAKEEQIGAAEGAPSPPRLQPVSSDTPLALLHRSTVSRQAEPDDLPLPKPAAQAQLEGLETSDTAPVVVASELASPGAMEAASEPAEEHVRAPESLADTGAPPQRILVSRSLGTLGEPASELSPLPLASRPTPQTGESDSEDATVLETSRPPRSSEMPGSSAQEAFSPAAHEAATREAATDEAKMLTASPARPPEVMAVAPPGSGTAPVLASRPLRPHFSLQRQPQAVPAALGAVVRQRLGVDVSDAPVHRSEGVTEASRDRSARAFTSAAEVYLPEQYGSVEGPATRALLGHELTHVAQQRRLGPSLPSEHSPEGRHLEAQALAVERSLSADGELPLARTSASTFASYTTAQRQAVEPPIPGPFSAPVQRADAAAPAASSPAAATPATVPGGSAQDMDELARKLYDRIQGRLRADLLIERERAGLLADS